MREPFDQGGKVLGQRCEPLDEGLAPAQFRDVGLFAFAKPREHPALLVHVFHAQARPPAIPEGRTADRLEHVPRLRVADAFQIVEKLALLRCELCGGRQVLQ